MSNMLQILICTYDSMLIKGLENPLRDAGFSVTVTDHAASAIRKVMEKLFAAVVLDSQVVGLSVDEALPIIRHVSPDTKVFVIGEAGAGQDVYSIPRQSCLPELIRIIDADFTVKETV